MSLSVKQLGNTLKEKHRAKARRVGFHPLVKTQGFSPSDTVLIVSLNFYFTLPVEQEAA